MRHVKHLLVTALAVLLAFVMAVPAFAVEGTSFTYTGDDATTNGKISISNATKDETYILYKVFDATYDATDNTKISYTVKAGSLKAELGTTGTDYFVIGETPDADGNYAVTRAGTTTGGVFTPTKTDAELIAYLKTITDKFGTIGEIKSTTDGEISFNNIPYGYYYITTTSGTQVTIDSNNPTATLIDKNQEVSFDKNIVESATSEVKVNEASTGEDVDFKIAVKAKNYDGEDKVFKYVVYDTLDNGWTLKAAPVVKIAGTEKTADTDYTISYKDKNGTTTTDITKAQYFEITINWTNDGTKAGTHLYASNVDLEVTYSAFLDAANKPNDVNVGATPNKNTADVKYFKGTDTTTPSGDLPDVVTETYTTSLTIIKQDQDSKALEGAEFTLTGNGADILIVTKNEFTENAEGTYYKLNDGTYTEERPNGEETHDAAYADTTKKYAKTTTVTAVGTGQTVTDLKAEVDAEGKVTFSGLGAGTYKLVETKVPAGYNKVADIDFTISFDNNPESDDYKKFASNNESITLDATNKVFNTTVINNKGTELPSTGGIGTTIIYIVGGGMVLAGIVMFLTKRRMASVEE